MDYLDANPKYWKVNIGHLTTGDRILLNATDPFRPEPEVPIVLRYDEGYVLLNCWVEPGLGMREVVLADQLEAGFSELYCDVIRKAWTLEVDLVEINFDVELDPALRLGRDHRYKPEGK
jgi:hypothetical protein